MGPLYPPPQGYTVIDPDDVNEKIQANDLIYEDGWTSTCRAQFGEYCYGQRVARRDAPAKVKVVKRVRRSRG